MELHPAPDTARNQSGIALFMVIAAISVLAILVTEFTYIAQVNQSIAFDGLDQLKAHYLAKSGLKLSLLRLKAYQQVKGILNNASGGKGGGIPGLPKQALDKIWSFPFFYPIPTNIPGMTMQDKEKIDKFQKSSGLEGKFSAVIESESSKYNLNSMLAPFAASAQPSPSPSVSATPAPTPTPGSTPSPSPSFDPQIARDSMKTYLAQILDNKFETDSDWASLHRDFRLEDLMENIYAWSDPTYEKKGSVDFDRTGIKRAPFYSVSELHMIPPMEDEIFELIEPALTASITPGININTMGDRTLKALLPKITEDEVKEFFKFRDSEEEDNIFKSADDFFAYLVKNISYFRGDKGQVDQFKGELEKRGIRLVTDESEFKITVRAQLNNSTRVIEAWVSMGSQAKSSSKPTTTTPTAPAAPGSPPLSGPGFQEKPDAGLRITFMRIL